MALHTPLADTMTGSGNRERVGRLEKKINFNFGHSKKEPLLFPSEHPARLPPLPSKVCETLLYYSQKFHRHQKHVKLFDIGDCFSGGGGGG